MLNLPDALTHLFPDRFAPGMVAAGLALLVAVHPAAHGQANRGSNVPAATAVRSSQNLEGPSWASLTQAQRQALAPLEQEWASIDSQRKQKWLSIATRMPKMSPAERERVQARMHDWTKLSPQERTQARLHYQEARQITPEDRKELWEEYQSLPPEKRQELAARAKPPAKAASGAKSGERASKEWTATKKSNVVPDPAAASWPRAVGPTVVQAKPGATTTLISRQPSPPPHQSSGLPKIAATPDFVDRTTLLPKKGPQAANHASIAASGPARP